MPIYELQSLQDIFNGNKFKIPSFQRGYSWETAQLEDFWEDIMILPAGKLHYMGMLTVEKKDDEADVLWVVNGQQRLTTSIILINELLKRMGEEERLPWQKKFLFSFGYDNGNPSNAHFKTNILRQAAPPNTEFSQNLYTLNLDKAQKFFERETGKETSKSKGNIFKGY